MRPRSDTRSIFYPGRLIGAAENGRPSAVKECLRFGVGRAQALRRRLCRASRSAPRSSRTLSGTSAAPRVQCSRSSMKASISPASTTSIGPLAPAASIFAAIVCVEDALSARDFSSTPTFHGISTCRPPTSKWMRSGRSGTFPGPYSDDRRLLRTPAPRRGPASAWRNDMESRIRGTRKSQQPSTSRSHETNVTA
jgi:hypothetical protein